MNFESTLKNIEDTIKSGIASLEVFKKKYKQHRDYTSIFLNVCRKYKIKRVAVGVSCADMDRCKNWPFDFSGSVFTDDTRDKRTGNPAIWQVLRELNIMGCGNSNQAQFNSEAMLIDGIYEYKNGKWKRK